MTQPITWECSQKQDEQGECDHVEHRLEQCSIESCMGFIVNWETWNPPEDFICAICHDCGYHYDENGELVQP